jgi:hypothetical protein
MVTKKGTKKQPRKSTTAPATASKKDAASELAFHISAILNHPDTPRGIYNALADEVSALEAPARFYDSREHIEIRLRAHMTRREKGGAR